MRCSLWGRPNARVTSRHFSRWHCTVGKHLFCDIPAAATESAPVAMPKLYEKPCRHARLYGNLKSTVSRLCGSVTCASRPNRIGRSQAYNGMHGWRRASTDGTYLKIMPPAPNRGAREPVWAVRPGYRGVTEQKSHVRERSEVKNLIFKYLQISSDVNKFTFAEAEQARDKPKMRGKAVFLVRF
jgi:hypothetical protein